MLSLRRRATVLFGTAHSPQDDSADYYTSNFDPPLPTLSIGFPALAPATPRLCSGNCRAARTIGCLGYLKDDVNLSERFHVKEAAYFELRADAFNIANRQIFAGPYNLGPNPNADDTRTSDMRTGPWIRFG